MITTTYEAFGTYRPCPICKAPAVAPNLPDGWRLDLIKEGPKTGPVDTWMTPHTPDCTAETPRPDPGMAVRIDGNYVTSVHVDPALSAELRRARLIADGGSLWVAPAGTPGAADMTGWTRLGGADSDGFVTE